MRLIQRSRFGSHSRSIVGWMEKRHYSLVISPFDIVFGRNIKGVLQLIENSWLKDDMPEKVRSKNVIDYVLQLRDRICSSLQIVNANEEIAKKRSKVLYDRNTKPVSYKVLVLVGSKPNSLGHT